MVTSRAPHAGAHAGPSAGGRTPKTTATAAAARLFIALWPDKPVREAMHRWPSPASDHGPGDDSARLTPIGQLHLTLHFIGNVPMHRLPELRGGLGVTLRPFELHFHRLERWRGGLIVAPVDEAPRELLALQARLGDALRTLQLPVDDRPFTPHVTVARRHRGTGSQWPVPPLRWAVQHYALVESRHAAGGGYRLLKSWPALATDLPAAQGAEAPCRPGD